MLSYLEPLKMEKISYYAGNVCIDLELTISLSLYSRGGTTECRTIALAFVGHTGASTGDPAKIRELFNFDSPAYLDRIRTCILGGHLHRWRPENSRVE